MKKEKHNHKLTNLLKVVIFGVIMIAPFFAVLSKTLYVTFNKNAQDSYYNYNNKEENIINVGNNLESGKNYTLTIGYVPYTENQQEVVFYVKNVTANFTASTPIEQTDRIRIFTTNNNTNVYFYSGATYITDRNYSNQNYSIVNFTYISKNNVNLLPQYQTITYSEFNKNDYLDNAFYDAINDLHEQAIFNWAKDTGIYNALNTFTTGLTGTTNSTLALLLAYWFIITAIYIVIDIIIFAFTYLTHFFNN